MELIRGFLRKVREKKLTVRCIGDNLIDEYYEVQVNRISPEFPMPILASRDPSPIVRLGGVGNVAHQFHHFNVFVDPLGFTDSRTTPLEFIYVRGTSIHFDGGFIPRKCRFLADGVQVNRWDIEAPNYGLTEAALRLHQDMLIRELERHTLEPVDVTIFSDYDKGTFKRDINWISKVQEGITIVDPKKLPLSRWQGCTVFKPNAKEAEVLSGYTDWKDQAGFFSRELNCKGVFITYGGAGVKGIWDGEYFTLEKNPSHSIASVIGAGDCFVAVLGLALGHGYEGRDAAEIAYAAGYQYVRYDMNQAICPAEMCSDKIVDPEDLESREFKLVFTNGCFDILHAGHLESLRFAKSKGAKLVVAVNSDASVRRLKGPSRPIIPLEERMKMLAALEMVDFVTSFEEDTPLEVIEKIRPDVLVKSGDYQNKKVVGQDIVPEFYLAPYVPGISTSEIVWRAAGCHLQ